MLAPVPYPDLPGGILDTQEWNPFTPDDALRIGPRTVRGTCLGPWVHPFAWSRSMHEPVWFERSAFVFWARTAQR